MQATQSRIASELVEQSIEFAALRRIDNRIALKLYVGVGRVAEGVGLAHDRANLLGALSLYSELLARSEILHEEYREFAVELWLLSDRNCAN